MFLREYGRTSDFYTDDQFQPNFIKEPRDFLLKNQSDAIQIATELCDKSYQCRYDYGMTFDEDVAVNTRWFYESLMQSQEINRKYVILSRLY